MVRKEYRSHVGVILAILQSVSSHNGIGITKLMLEANLPHKRAKNYLERLVTEGYVKTEEEGGRSLYKMTKEGREFLRSLEWTKSFFENLGYPL
ncbi:MAG: hypothetical protein GWO20_13910 [Candidatus Korarchaeota archaeon]|nr:hypothetical protein [Candidatus Korarchaeota archaeon]NIU84512.1 hypothetical protein [Candidatus Thorarchaeota archaeon]NIW14579.1 hypothetical protein [Candidatus Thorarchaeota archaeon]NIW52651.1 hypothetical protein [Candidatus Korarchaeota archaeon]